MPGDVPLARSVEPAISTINWVKLRPFKGRSEMALLSTTLPICESAVCNAGGAAETCTGLRHRADFERQVLLHALPHFHAHVGRERLLEPFGLGGYCVGADHEAGKIVEPVVIRYCVAG